MIFIRSQTIRMAAMISSSETVMIRETCSRMMAKLSSPREVKRPSAIVRGLTEGTMTPWARSGLRQRRRRARRLVSLFAVSSSSPLTPFPPTDRRRQRCDEHFQVGDLVEQFKCRRALSGDDQRVVVGVDLNRAGFGDHARQSGLRASQGGFANVMCPP